MERGGSIDIPLRIFGTSLAQVEFRIRSQPEHGRLSAVLPVGREAASVTYFNEAPPGTTSDRFTYAAKTSGGFSSAVEVSIEIADAPPLLTAPADLPFPDTVAGRSNRQTLAVANRGGGIAQGTLRATGPWRIEGETSYRIEPDVTQTFTIVFEPRATGPARGLLTYSSRPELSTSLAGNAIPPASISPPDAALVPRPGDLSRAATLTFTNHTPDPLALSLDLPKPLEGPSRLELPPNASHAVPFSLPAHFVEAWSGTLTASGPLLDARAELRADAAPALLSVEPASLDFGSVRHGDSPARSLILLNLGGQHASVEMAVPKPFRAQGPTRIHLAPRSTAEIPVTLDDCDPGSHSARATFRGANATLHVDLSAHRLPRSPAPQTAPAGPAETTAPPSPAPGFPAIADLRILETGRQHALLAWNPAPIPLPTYHLERRKLAIDPSGNVAIQWLRVENVPIRERPGRITATLSPLPPATLFTLRVLATSPTGERTAPSDPVQFLTPQRTRLTKQPALWIGLATLATLIAIAARRLARSRQPAPPAES